MAIETVPNIETGWYELISNAEELFHKYLPEEVKSYLVKTLSEKRYSNPERDQEMFHATLIQKSHQEAMLEESAGARRVKHQDVGNRALLQCGFCRDYSARPFGGIGNQAVENIGRQSFFLVYEGDPQEVFRLVGEYFSNMTRNLNNVIRLSRIPSLEVYG